MAETILIVDDEQDLVNTLEYNLEREGYETRSALNAADALELLDREPDFDLVILDLMLPDMSGTEVCRKIRQTAETAETPVLMLTAKGEEIDRVVGFEVGADDYVVKPFSVRELTLRIRAILRRSNHAEEPEEVGDELEFGNVSVDVPGHRVWVDDEEIRLTALEFKLLTTFMRRKGRVQTREVLLSDVWDINADVMTRTVDTHVKRLREKLGSAGDYIETIRGVGYRFKARPDKWVT
ncbi:response regulator transcription factor [Persicimonas caeni]|uniref:Response regulator transcription factor n=1 Tax=Persicimonas caeni TaxID=2292766 RepID=A0A4Y6PX35_PERCE|nr:response regulator transcription factor [Persicimonas caeni]QDG52882.1 response regulator transcription factor [Persicimonas caeni]QED34104.1 response regulator transcription factor [Persicimonas caeni]